MTVYNGQRWSTASAYLRPALARKNLSAQTEMMVTKIIFEGKKAIGVEYEQVKLILKIVLFFQNPFKYFAFCFVFHLEYSVP